MSVQDGNPTTFAPELLAGLTRWERSFMAGIFARRLARVGAGKRKYPDDESAASVARRTTIEALVFAWCGLIWIPSQIASICLGGTIWDGGWWTVGLAVFGPVTVALVVAAWLRCRRVNRYFLERFPGSLHRSVFEPGFAPEIPEAAEPTGPALPSSVEAGNPGTFAPDLLATLTSLERRQVALAYAGRVVKIGQGKDKYPDDEPAASVAHRAIRQGVTYAGWLVVFPFTAGFGAANTGLLLYRTTGWVIANIAFATLLVGIWVVFRKRRHRIDRYFAADQAARP